MGENTSIRLRADAWGRIDEGALRAIMRKESGGRLLPAGVIRVEGSFASHQAVRLVVRRRRKLANRTQITTSASRSSLDGDFPDPSSPSLFDHLPLNPPNRHTQLHAGGSTGTTSLPETPSIQPIMSLSSSIASLDPLSRSVPPSPAMNAITERFASTTITASPLTQELRPFDQERGSQGSGESDEVEWEETEIGKGLAHYNSVEIDRIKGMKR